MLMLKSLQPLITTKYRYYTIWFHIFSSTCLAEGAKIPDVSCCCVCLGWNLTWLRSTNDALHIQQPIPVTAACSLSSRVFIVPPFSALSVLTAGSHLSHRVVSAWGAFLPALHFPHTQKCRGQGLSERVAWLVLLSRNVWYYSFTLIASKKDAIFQNSAEGRQYEFPPKLINLSFLWYFYDIFCLVFASRVQSHWKG